MARPLPVRHRVENAGARALLRTQAGGEGSGLGRLVSGALGQVIGRALGPVIERDGRLLDRQAQLAIALQRLARKRPAHRISLEAARMDLEVDTQALAPTPPAMERVTPLSIPGPGSAGPVAARVYRPRGLASSGLAPALLYMHGGGFVVGSLDSHDGLCRLLAAGARAVVISIDYRLGPEHPFPAAVDDCLAAFRFLAREAERLGLDPKRIAVGGDSAGGNLAAVVSQATRADQRRPCFQLLLYPATDMTRSLPSHATMGEGFFLDRALMDWFLEGYLPGGARATDLRDPRLSPLFGDLGAQPPALVTTAGFDPLRDEGEAYARGLAAAGNVVEYREYSSLFHGFYATSGVIVEAARALDETIGSLRRALATDTSSTEVAR